MGLINIPHIEEDADATPELWNSRYDTLVDLVNGNLTADNFASGAVTTPKIADGAVTSVKLDADAITSEKLNATIACRAYKSAAQNTSNGVATKVTLGAENFDLGNNFDTTNSRFVAPTTGYYQVNAAVRYADLADGAVTIAYIYVNGAEYSHVRAYNGTTDGDPHAHISDLVPVTAGQYIELYALQNSGTEALSTGTTITYMSIHFVGV